MKNVTVSVFQISNSILEIFPYTGIANVSSLDILSNFIKNTGFFGYGFCISSIATPVFNSLHSNELMISFSIIIDNEIYRKNFLFVLSKDNLMLNAI
jgi:hypothetical protein